MGNWIVKHWDQWIYARAFHTLRRMVRRNPGLAYLFRLHLEGYCRQYPIPSELEKATRAFYFSYIEAGPEPAPSIDAKIVVLMEAVREMCNAYEQRFESSTGGLMGPMDNEAMELRAALKDVEGGP